MTEFKTVPKMYPQSTHKVPITYPMLRPEIKNEKNHKCEICNKNFTTRQHKWRHSKYHCKNPKELKEIEKKEKLLVKVNPFDNPDHSHLTDMDYLTAIKKGNLGIPHIIEQLHFNTKKKDNYNVYISNKKKNYVDVFTGRKWIKEICDETLFMMIENNMNIIEDKIEFWKDNDPKFYKKHKHIIEKFPRLLDKYSSDK